MRLTIFLAVVLTAGGLAAADTPAARQYQALLDEYEQEGGPRLFSQRFLEHARQHADDPTAVDALQWVVAKVRGRSDTEQALQLLAERHLASEQLAAACESIAKSRASGAEKLLRALLQQSPHKAVRAQACYALARLLDTEASIHKQLQDDPDLAPRVLQYYGAEYGRHLSSLEPAKLEAKREQAYQQLLSSFADVPVAGGTMGQLAEKALFAIRHLSVGKVAPEIQGEDLQGREFKLSDYRGKVVMLTFWGHW